MNDLHREIIDHAIQQMEWSAKSRTVWTADFIEEVVVSLKALRKSEADLRAELAAAKAELVRNADELASAIKQRDEARGQTWYLLYGGTSEDGKGIGHYIGRTTDKEVARKHHAELRKNPYSIGFVEIVTDTEKKWVSYYGRELETKKKGGGA